MLDAWARRATSRRSLAPTWMGRSKKPSRSSCSRVMWRSAALRLFCRWCGTAGALLRAGRRGQAVVAVLLLDTLVVVGVRPAPELPACARGQRGWGSPGLLRRGRRRRRRGARRPGRPSRRWCAAWQGGGAGGDPRRGRRAQGGQPVQGQGQVQGLQARGQDAGRGLRVVRGGSCPARGAPGAAPRGAAGPRAG